MDTNLVSEVTNALETYGVEPGWLIIEVTETALTGMPSKAFAAIEGLRSVGVHVGLDDFATRDQVPLVGLRAKPFEIKIDRSYITAMTADPAGSVIAKLLVTMGHELGAIVVGEGVESRAMQEMLRGIGCDQAQGYHIARPMDGPRLEDWLAAQFNRSPRAA